MGYKQKRLSSSDFFNAYDIEEDYLNKAKLKKILTDKYSESNELEYKEKLIEYDKVAKHLLAMANSGGGGLVFGIADNGELIGLTDVPDQTKFEQSVRKYLPHSLKFKYEHFKFDEKENKEDEDPFAGKEFILAFVFNQDYSIPFISERNSNELNDNVVYVRKEASTKVANSDDINEIIQRRIEAQYEDISFTTLDDHLAQLKVMYQFIPRTKNGLAQIPTTAFGNVPNPSYPNEDYDSFLSNLINKKKKLIEQVVEVSYINKK